MERKSLHILQLLWKKVSGFKHFLMFLILLLTCSSSGWSQKFSINPGFGWGVTSTNMESPERKIRFVLYLEGYYDISDHVSFGFEAATSDGLLRGFSNNDQIINQVTIINPANMSAYTLLGKVKYTLAHRDLLPFVELGFGSNTFFQNHPVASEEKIERENFSFQANVGIVVSKFQFSLGYWHGGKTPSFMGTEPNSEVVLPSTSISSVFLKSSYRIDLGSRSKK